MQLNKSVFSTLLSDLKETHLFDDFLILSTIMQWFHLHFSLDFYLFFWHAIFILKSNVSVLNLQLISKHRNF